MGTESPEGLGYLERADALIVARLGEAHPQRVRVAGNTCVALSLLGRNEQALALAEKTLARAADVLPPNHRWIGILHERAGIALLKLHRHDEALTALERAVTISKTSKDDRELGSALTNKGDVLIEMEKPRDAIAVFDQALEALAHSVPPDHDFVADAYKGRSIARLHARDAAGAIADLERAIAIYAAAGQIASDVREGLTEARVALGYARREVEPRHANEEAGKSGRTE
jgi:tetratricopeptide (TPR) repeat protein